MISQDWLPGRQPQFVLSGGKDGQDPIETGRAVPAARQSSPEPPLLWRVLIAQRLAGPLDP